MPESTAFRTLRPPRHREVLAVLLPLFALAALFGQTLAAQTDGEASDSGNSSPYASAYRHG